MTSPEGERLQERPTSAVMRVDDFTPQMLGDIVGIYKETVHGGVVGMWIEDGNADLIALRHAQTLETWDRFGSYAEYRLGSELTINSKLWLRRKPVWVRDDVAYGVEVWFDGNLEHKAPERQKQREKELKEQFAERVQSRIGYSPEEI